MTVTPSASRRIGTSAASPMPTAASRSGRKARSEEERLIELAALSALRFRVYMEFVRGWRVKEHQEEWFKALQELADGELVDGEGRETNKLQIWAFPGSAKTHIGGIGYTEWMIGRAVLEGRDPEVGYICYGDQIAALRGAAIKDTIARNPRYKLVFPGVQMAPERGDAKDEWFIRHLEAGNPNPTLRAGGINGAILSYRFGGLEVIDDPHDYKTVGSSSERERVWTLYQGSVKTRATHETTPVVLMCTPWAEDDLPNRLKAFEKGWRVIVTPAVREDGKAAWPPDEDGGRSLKWLAEMAATDSYIYQTQYLCQPPSQEAGVFRLGEDQPMPPMEEVKGIYIFYDTAYTAKSWSSYNAGVTAWQLKNGKVMRAGFYQRKCDTVDLMEDIRRDVAVERERTGLVPTVVLENQASGPAIAQSLQRYSGVRVITRNIPRFKNAQGKMAPGDLLQRANAVAHFSDSGRIFFPTGLAKWKEDLKRHLKSYPYGENGPKNDAVAADVLVCEHLLGSRGGPLPTVRVERRGW